MELSRPPTWFSFWHHSLLLGVCIPSVPLWWLPLSLPLQRSGALNPPGTRLGLQEGTGNGECPGSTVVHSLHGRGPSKASRLPLFLHVEPARRVYLSCSEPRSQAEVGWSTVPLTPCSCLSLPLAQQCPSCHSLFSPLLTHVLPRLHSLTGQDPFCEAHPSDASSAVSSTYTCTQHCTSALMAASSSPPQHAINA